MNAPSTLTLTLSSCLQVILDKPAYLLGDTVKGTVYLEAIQDVDLSGPCAPAPAFMLHETAHRPPLASQVTRAHPASTATRASATLSLPCCC